MSGICGFVGAADPAIVGAMLTAIDYRGDRTDTATAPGVAPGSRWWGGRPGTSPGIHRAGPDLVACAGTLAPPVPSPAAALVDRLRPGPDGLDRLDGAFAGAWWDGQRRRLTLVRDPFGVRSLYHVEHRGVFYFASELKQPLAIPDLPVQPDPVALPQLELRGSVEKHRLKEAVRDLLPRTILDRPKSGMLVPVEGWFARRGGPLHADARERLLDGLTTWDLVRRPWLERLLAGRLDGLRPRHGAKTWLLVTLEAWLRAVLGRPAAS